ncbi:MAG: hypothetical protein D6692_09915 [Planctomycetota bacterium]|nr:MAG: hypothetical protein D6692_09915 [Planctomycetota bacterium]
MASQTTAQQIDWPALQLQADAAIAQAQQELQDTDALILFTREDALQDWNISITGIVAGTAVDYAGVVDSIDASGASPVLVTTPPVPTFDASADMCTPMLRAAAVTLLDVDDFVTELFFEVNAPLEDTADPERLEDVDIETLPMFTVTQTTTQSPGFSLLDPGGALSTAESYLSLATDYGLSKEAVQDLIAARLTEAETIEAFRAGAVNILGEIGISEQAASDVFDLRRSLGNTPEYYQQAFALLAAAGEPVHGLIADSTPLDDPDGPLARVQDPGDIEIELYGETEVEVSVPPFVKVKVKVGVKVKGKLSEYAQLEAALRAHLATAAQAAKEQAEQQLQNLKDAIDSLIEMFKQYIDNLDVAGWVQWLLR